MVYNNLGCGNTGFGGGFMMLLYYLILIGVVIALALLIKKLWMDTQNKDNKATRGNRTKKRVDLK